MKYGEMPWTGFGMVWNGLAGFGAFWNIPPRLARNPDLQGGVLLSRQWSHPDHSIFSRRVITFFQKDAEFQKDSSDSSDSLVIRGDAIGDRLILIIKRWPRIRILASSSGALDR